LSKHAEIVTRPANLIDSTEVGVNFDFTSHQGLYLDPAAGTGWLVDAFGSGIERLSC
jgi:hypothetical protein